MGWADKELKKYRVHRAAQAIMRDPRYVAAQKQERDEAVKRALDMFLVVSAAYLHDRLGYGRTRIIRYLEYVDEQMQYLVELPDYFESMNAAIREETGVDVMRLEVSDR